MEDPVIGFSLREELAKTLFAWSAQGQQPGASWDSADTATQLTFFGLVQAMQPWIIKWAAIIVAESIEAAYKEGLVQGWVATIPDTIPEE